MTNQTSNDAFAAVREAGTAAPNYDLDNNDIIARLQQWQSLCTFNVTAAEPDTIDIEFTTLPADMTAFASDVYEFCPDTVDQGTGCMAEMVEMMEETGEELSPEMESLIDGVDFSDENYGLEILKRQLERGKAIQLWWD